MKAQPSGRRRRPGLQLLLRLDVPTEREPVACSPTGENAEATQPGHGELEYLN